MNEYKTTDGLVGNNASDAGTAKDYEMGDTKQEVLDLLGLKPSYLLSSITRKWSNSWTISLSGGDDAARIGPDMTVTLVKALNPNTDVYKFWFVVDLSLSSLGWRSISPNPSITLRFKNRDDGVLYVHSLLMKEFGSCSNLSLIHI